MMWADQKLRHLVICITSSPPKECCLQQHSRNCILANLPWHKSMLQDNLHQSLVYWFPRSSACLASRESSQPIERNQAVLAHSITGLALLRTSERTSCANALPYIRNPRDNAWTQPNALSGVVRGLKQWCKCACLSYGIEPENL